MAEITLKVDRERINELTLDTLIALEEGTMPARAIRDLMAKFMVDDDGEWMPEDEALQIIGRSKVSHLAPILTDFADRLKEAAVPPASGGGS